MKTCHKNNPAIFFSSPVHKIEHHNGSVTVYTDSTRYRADKIIITVSAGVLQSGAISFPRLPASHAFAIQQLGFGCVMKMLLRFKERFWLKKHDDIGFLLSDEKIPTWWTQLPGTIPLLTGWLGGPSAAQCITVGSNSLLEMALSSLSSIFHTGIDFLRDQLCDHQVICWQENPYTRGGYSYSTPDSMDAKKILLEPVNDTIYFAGEALYTGDLQGTVEAALGSGDQAAKMIMNS